MSLLISKVVLFGVLLVVLLAGCGQKASAPTLIWSVSDQVITDQTPLRFEIRQHTGVPLLIKISGYEAEYKATFVDSNSLTSNSARLPYIRLGPLYQFIPAPNSPSISTLEVTGINVTKNASVSVEVFSLPTITPADRGQSEAFRLVSDAIQSTDSEDLELWQERVQKLERAIELFKKFGQNQDWLWIEYYAAYFSYFPLYQYNDAITLAKDICKKSGEAGMNELELMALQLQGQALIERNAKDSEEMARLKLIEAQSILKRAYSKASQLGFQFEKAWSANNQGVGYLYAGKTSLAIQRLQEAAQLSMEISDSFLANLVRENIVAAKVESGDLGGAIETLQEINKTLRLDENRSRIGRNQVEIGRLYRALYDFPKAIKSLSSGLSNLRDIDDHESMGRTMVSLGSTYFEIGNIKRSKELILQAINELELANFGRGLYDAYQITANINRKERDFRLMNQYRGRQKQLLATDNEDAFFNYSLAKDYLAQNQISEAQKHFKLSAEMADRTDNLQLRELSRLNACVVANQLNNGNDHCTSKSLWSAFQALESFQQPKYQFEGRYLWSRLLLQENQIEKAMILLDRLIGDIQLYRIKLPGVLGAWYWENRKRIFELFLRTHLDKALKSTDIPIDSLIALDRLKNFNFSPDRSPRELTGGLVPDKELGSLRILLAKRSSNPSPLDRIEISNQIDQKLLSLRRNSSSNQKPIHQNWIHSLLRRLPEDTMFLAYYMLGEDIYTWTANQHGAKLDVIKTDPSTQEAFDNVLRNARTLGRLSVNADLEEIGKVLLEPISSRLPKTIFYLPTGVFNGFPLEILKTNGAFLAEHSQVINLYSLRSLETAIEKHSDKVTPRTVFLASNSEFYTHNLADLPGVSLEADAIKKSFDGSEIHVVEGEDLVLDSFRSTEFKTANLIHIATHVSINTEYPELSKIHLSPLKTGDITTEEFLTPADLVSQDISAQLVVLSACDSSGVSRFTFDSNLGFVSDFLRSGATSVIASLWPIPDRQTALQMKYFYTLLKEGKSPSEALTIIKRDLIRQDDRGRLDVWASFQLYM